MEKDNWNYEPLVTFEYKEFKLEIYWNGLDRLPNKVYLAGLLEEVDETFKPSPLYDYDSIQTITTLIDYCLQEVPPIPGEDRCNNQLINWANTSETADILRPLIYDISTENEYMNEAIKFFEKHIIR